MLLESRDNIYSDNDEGVLKCIMEKLGIDCGTCCGKYCPTTFNLVKEKNWKVLYVEGDEEKYKDLLDTQKESPVCKIVTGTNLGSLILDNGFPEDLDLLCGIDYEIWKDLEKVRPKIVVVEPTHCERSPYWIKKMVKEKGYRFLYTVEKLFFIRDDIELEGGVKILWWLSESQKNYVFTVNNNIYKEHIFKFCEDLNKYSKGESVIWDNPLYGIIAKNLPTDLKNEDVDNFCKDIYQNLSQPS